MATILKKFIRGLNLKIAPLVYASNPANIENTINTTTRIATGFELNAGSSKINQIERDDKIAELKEQIANLALIEQLKAEQQKADKN